MAIKTIIKDGFKFVYNYNTTNDRNYPYMIHIYKMPQNTCVYYQQITKSQDSKWTYDYMTCWFDKWIKINGKNT